MDGVIAHGRVYKDDVGLADLPPLAVAIGVADNNPFHPATDGDGKGIIGLGFPQLNILGEGSEPLFDCVVAAGHLKSNVFSFAISKTTNQNELVFGDTSDWAATNPQWIDVDASEGYWQIPAQVNGFPINGIVSERRYLLRLVQAALLTLDLFPIFLSSIQDLL